MLVGRVVVVVVVVLDWYLDDDEDEDDDRRRFLLGARGDGALGVGLGVYGGVGKGFESRCEGRRLVWRRWGRGEMMVLLLFVMLLLLLPLVIVVGERPGGVIGAKSD